ncbi:uncharacterized protein LOC120726012 isoform X1 [Simochromis diagramma]|uniref:uncharacterized protein LOC120726012 isoform X1 n=1 Tax=Simochromis diagramma TaxID=43689 RepID=UPI001A7EFF0A|nr:uncharacterized protein LOC120726012 isoform X1 [Simochromis diagramma]
MSFHILSLHTVLWASLHLLLSAQAFITQDQLFTGRYDVHQAIHRCQTWQQQCSPDLKDLVRSGYWPASVNMSTLYTLDLLSSFLELKTGRAKSDALQHSFLDEEEQLCCDVSFSCPACTPEMLAVSVDELGCSSPHGALSSCEVSRYQRSPGWYQEGSASAPQTWSPGQILPRPASSCAADPSDIG